MKDKRAEQVAKKLEHKEQLKSKRRSEPNLERPAPELIVKPSILIVCEGENTEPSYFNQFKLSTATIKSVGEGYNTISLVNRAIQLSKEKQFDQVWCVFDKDDFNENDFNNAILIAEAHGINVAYSNQSFEYWLILHFDDHQGGGMHRKYYNQKINDLINSFGITYDGFGNKIISEAFFELLNGFDPKTNKTRIDNAISRAKRNYKVISQNNPAKEESSTTVFKLVENLLNYL